MSTRRSFLKNIGFSVSALTVLPFAGCTKSKRKPNIIYILADDMGYGDVSCLNEHSKLRTKHIDSIGNNGIKFTDAHSGSAVCTPTRYGILTGRYAWRSRLKSGVLWGYSPPLIPPERLTVASLLKEFGYTTGCIGKWHLGLGWKTLDGKTPPDSSTETGENVDLSGPVSGGPNAVGFDYSFIIPASLDMFPYVYVENNKVTVQPDRDTENSDDQKFWRKGPTGADFEHEQVLPKLTQKAVEFVDQNAQKPFFLYFPLPAPHTPILPTKEFLGKSKTTIYGDFVLQCDWTVGQVLEAIRNNNIEENTLVIFASDNGCSPRAHFDELEKFDHDPSYVFRGHKADIFEGGHRIPFIVKWPQVVKNNRECKNLVCLTDLLATCADLLGTNLPDNAGEDSMSFFSVLSDTKPGIVREAVVHHSVNGEFAIRKGKWKLEMCPGSGGWSYPRPGRDDTSELPPIQLYDLETDIGETINVQHQHPDVVKELTGLLTGYVKNGKSAPGTIQKNDPPENWSQLKWMDGK